MTDPLYQEALPQIMEFERALQGFIQQRLPCKEDAFSLWAEITDSAEYGALCDAANNVSIEDEDKKDG